MTICPNDGAVFEPKRPWQRFCQPRCRFAFHRSQFVLVPRNELEQLAAITGKLLTHEHVTP